MLDRVASILPVAADPAAGSREASAAATPRVLVVDDEPSNREALARRLRRRGLAVDTAADGPAALAALADGEIDVVLLDVMMPGMSGLEVLTRVRRTHTPAELPVIMATAQNGSEDVVDALSRGASDYVTKPLDFPVVLARVLTQIALRQSVRKGVILERRLSDRNAELESANLQLAKVNSELRRSVERNRRELQLAAKVQAAFLPRPGSDLPGLRFAWRFEPCVGLAGDAVNIFRLDADHVALYVLDVSGHGVAAALTAVAASRLLAPGHDPDSILLRPGPEGGPPRPVAPSAVADELARRFAWNPDTAQFLTVFYATYHAPTRRLAYASAGHPGAIHVRPGRPPATLESTGQPIGVGDVYEQGEVQLAAGDRLYLYSDGVTEAAAADGRQFGFQQLAGMMGNMADCALDDGVSLLQRRLDDWRCGRPAEDDVTILAVECV